MTGRHCVTTSWSAFTTVPEHPFLVSHRNNGTVSSWRKELLLRWGAMMNRRSLQDLICTSLAFILTGCASLPVAAATSGIPIGVNVSLVNFYVNGALTTPASGMFSNQGVVDVPDALIYDGTTYVPIRLAAELLGQTIQWNAAQHGVDITKSSSPTQPPASGTAVTPPAGGVPRKVTAAAASIRFYVNGVDMTPPNGVFTNQGKVTVPDALIYDETTYVPIRLAASLLGQAIQWSGSLYAVVIGSAPLAVVAGETFGNGDGTVVEMNPSTGAWTPLGGPTAPSQGELSAGVRKGVFTASRVGIACDPGTGQMVAGGSDGVYARNPATGIWSLLGGAPVQMWGWDPVFGPAGELVAVGVPLSGGAHLYEWNPTSQTWKNLGDPSGGQGVSAVAFDPKSDAMAVGTNSGYVYEWDPSTQVWTSLGFAGTGGVSSLAFDPTTGQMVASLFNRTSGGIVEWSPSTQAWTPLGDQTAPPYPSSVVFNPVSGELMAGSDGGSVNGRSLGSGVYEWNTTTGTWTIFGGKDPAGGNGDWPVTLNPETGAVLAGVAIGVSEWNPATQAWAYLGTGLPTDVGGMTSSTAYCPAVP